ncbi:MAG: SUMF1/EgtB/PvdO family nonheme iron enzyme [Nitrosomonas sp.]|nr:SUMF1/EgtB/PvdO family nonheme iron enzyme [Nitrosomonas sp.]
MSDIFICYSRKDIDTAMRLLQLFEAEGWRVFIDKQTHVGRRWHKEIEKELHATRAVVVLWSATSRDSDFVLEEAEYGKRKDILFPAFIESVEFPYGFGRIQTADLIGWNNQPGHPGSEQLLAPLRLHLNGDAAKPAQSIGTPSLAPGQTFRDKLQTGGEGPLMVVIPSGRFLMGSLNFDSDETPEHIVQIAQPFALGVYAVTFDEYDRFCQETGRTKPGDKNWGRENRPVINLSWHDAQAYCDWLSQQTTHGYRLPSEAEWEYACRAGTKAPYNTGDSIAKHQANFDGKQSLPVGSFPPNAFGLHDMHGNVREWIQDCWHDNYQNAPNDGSAWLEKNSGNCDRRMVRGGSWYSKLKSLRSAFRHGYGADDADVNLGFRIARTL